MAKSKRANHEELSLPQLCELVKTMSVPFEDVSEFIENRTYALCVDGKGESAIGELKSVSEFFESMQNKNEENCRDLADIYVMIGEVNQYVGCFKDSIDWFRKASVVFDRYAVPFHNLAISYIELGDINSAIKCLEQETALEPGNYFSRLKLADLYEQQGEFKKVEESLESLLSRNPENIQALHKLITHYEKRLPHIDVELLRKRLLAIDKKLSEIEMVIRVHHLCRSGMFAKALDFLEKRVHENPAMPMLYLLKAHVLGQSHQFSKKRAELVKFKQMCHGKPEYIRNRLDEFEHVFGKNAVARMGRILVVTNPNIIK